MADIGASDHSPSDDAIAPRQRSPWVRRLLLIGGLAVAIVFVGYVGLLFLGSQVQEVLRGTVEFGASGSGCVAEGRASAFPAGTSVYVVAYPSRDVPAGEVVTLRILKDGSEVLSSPQAYETELGLGDCLSGTVPAAALTPGHYRFEYVAGAELLASGEFDITS